ncbi:MAG: aminotransferase class I/II-fold pyridoxal phosphate-dependent enzyme [Acidimicrobiales bacterium]
MAASTLHAFVDLWAVLGALAGVVLVDAAAYPIGLMAIGAAQSAPRSVSGRAPSLPLVRRRVAHFDADEVRRHAADSPGAVVLLVDGLCPGCGRIAPLNDLVAAIRPFDGLVVVDDTQGLGLAGVPAAGGYGAGGGGSVRWSACADSDRLVVVASLAKAYGAPLAVTCGPGWLIDQLRAAGPLQLHGSGPNAAALAACTEALAAERSGAAAERRHRLHRLVRLFRQGVVAAGLPCPDGGRWPMQTLPVPAEEGRRAVQRLDAAGLRTVLVNRRCRPGCGLAVLVNATHTVGHIHSLTRQLAVSLPSIHQSPHVDKAD